MNKKILISVFVSVLLVGTAFAGTTAEAANGQAKGLYGFPGNSAFGRSHNPHFMYKWGNEEFRDMDELLEYIREYMETWRKLHQKSWKWEDRQGDSRSDVNVITRTATDIDEDSATLRGKLELDTDDSAEVWFEYGTRLSDLSEDSDTLTLDDEDNETFSIDITGLDEDTRYYFRAVAEDEDGDFDRGTVLSFITEDTDSDSNDGDEDEPEISTLSAQDITDDEATIRGKVDMNDFDNGLVFFVYGTDEDAVKDVEDDEDVDEYDDIDEDGDNLQVLKMNGSFDGYGTWVYDFEDLDNDTTYYYRIGLEYEDEDDDIVLVFGDVKEFTTED
jgi:hypothetical protein